jgi:hypothetical protein
MATRIITLTDSPPVQIDEANWPLIASAADKQHDGQIEAQANRTSKWFVGVRQHADGRAIVYAKYTYDTAWQGERNRTAARGVLLSAGTTVQEICEAITSVCSDIAAAKHNSGDEERWRELAPQCVADLPPERLN